MEQREGSRASVVMSAHKGSRAPTPVLCCVLRVNADNTSPLPCLHLHTLHILTTHEEREKEGASRETLVRVGSEPAEGALAKERELELHQRDISWTETVFNHHSLLVARSVYCHRAR